MSIGITRDEYDEEWRERRRLERALEIAKGALTSEPFEADCTCEWCTIARTALAEIAKVMKDESSK